MIKKSVFENELIHGMQRELQSHEKKQGMNNLVKAAEYLHSALEIFEGAGMTEKADQVLGILSKIAAKHDSNVKMMPSLQALMEQGVTHADLKGVGKGDMFSKARVCTAFRRLGYTDKEIAHFLGKHNLVSEEDAADILSPDRPYQKFMDWMENPTKPMDPNNLQPGEEFSITSLPAAAKPKSQPSALGPGSEISMQSVMGPKEPHLDEGEDLVFKSIAEELGVDDNFAKPRKPKNPTKVPNGHSKGLTSEKMVKNLENHGTVFNMADDGNVDIPQPDTFEDDYRNYMEMLSRQKRKKITEDDIDPDLVGLIQLDKGEADDLLDLEINENPIEVAEPSSGKTFEDE